MDTSDTFDVVILGFDTRDESPEVRLQRAFGIGAEPAAQIIARLPATVQRAVSRVRAEYFSRALVLAGARVEVRDEYGTVVAQVAASQPAAPIESAAAPAPIEIARAPRAIELPELRAVANTPPAPAPNAAASPAAAALYSPHAAPLRAGQTITTGAPTLVKPMEFTSAGDTAFGVRAPAHPTWQEAGVRVAAVATPQAPVPLARVVPTKVAVPAPAMAPAAEAANALWRDPSSVFDAPKAAPAVAKPLLLRGDPSDVWDAPPSTVPAADEAQVFSPRDPSSVLDPPLSKPLAAEPRAAQAPAPARARAQPAAAQPAAAGRPAAAAQPEGPHAVSLPPAGSQRPAPAERRAAPRALEGLQPNAMAALDDFDIGKSIAINALWRPPAAAPAVAAAAVPAAAAAPAPASVRAAAITLDGETAVEPMQVLSPWEQANEASMAEPSSNGHELRAAPRAVAARARPAAAPVQAKPAAQAVPAGAAIAPARAAAARAARAMPANNAAESAPHAPQPAANKAAPAVGIAERDQRLVARADVRSFWESLPDALRLPFSGPGLSWIAAISAASVIVGALDHWSLISPRSLSLFSLMAHTLLLAFACDYYRVCLWAPVASDQAIDRAPSLEPSRLFQTYAKSGLHLTGFMFVSQLPAIVRIVRSLDDAESLSAIARDPINCLLLLLPCLYWPMGVALTALGNDFAAIWNVPTGLRAVLRAPLEYAAVCLIGGIVFAVSWALLVVPLGAAFGSGALILVGTIGLPLALSHGVQGALMGHLVRARGDVFD